MIISKIICIIQVHFASEMWQQRADGKKKLNSDAIPTIFGFFIKKQNESIKKIDNNTQIIEFTNDSRIDNIQNKEQVCNNIIQLLYKESKF